MQNRGKPGSANYTEVRYSLLNKQAFHTLAVGVIPTNHIHKHSSQTAVGHSNICVLLQKSNWQGLRALEGDGESAVTPSIILKPAYY